ncbi:hypothetical protein F4561_003797 [Lipingzhangella halophila]|uniref:Sterol carrier protein n=1 Tax=Lipingzhangella halophila TaxID=1783352 RepID=A0A7W7RJE8_9ACTN|nr:hypothetical protein [Lipingzhangella halophila]MBB4932977.1 hypothetical protein [Lipingzhangella halophila]
MATPTVMADDWVENFTRVCNQDEELQAHGKHFDCSYMLQMGNHNYQVVMHRGRVEEILVDPGPLDQRYQFLLRASEDTWQEFGKTEPRPMAHGIWAATFREDMQMQGDLLVLMQNLRCFTRQMELLRVSGVPVQEDVSAPKQREPSQ